MNGWDIQKWNRAKEIAERNKLKIGPIGGRIEIYSGKQCLCVVDSVDEVFGFVCGYDWGKAKK